MNPSSIIKRNGTILIVIDVQEKLIPFISEKEKVIENIVKLIEFAKVLKIPILLTEQYPRGLGLTVEPIKRAMIKHKPLEKVSFSCFGAEGFSSALQRHFAKTVLLTGIEAHVCVAQTALDAIDAGYRVCVIKDAVSSRAQGNKQIGIDRVQERGAIVSSTEAIMFEILEKAGTQEFKEIAPLLK